MKMLPAQAFKNSADYARPYFHTEIDNDCTLDDLMRPAFWGHHVGSNGTLKKNALVDVIRADGTLDVQLRCVEVGQGYAVMRPLRVWEDEAAAAARAAAANSIANANAAEPVEQAPEDYKITHIPRGAQAGFGVTYLPTGAKLAAGLKLKADAIKAAIEHAKKAGTYVPAQSAAAPTQDEAA